MIRCVFSFLPLAMWLGSMVVQHDVARTAVQILALLLILLSAPWFVPTTRADPQVFSAIIGWCFGTTIALGTKMILMVTVMP